MNQRKISRRRCRTTAFKARENRKNQRMKNSSINNNYKSNKLLTKTKERSIK
jgi:hypothetical protein